MHSFNIAISVHQDHLFCGQKYHFERSVHQKSLLGGQETVWIPSQAGDDYARPTAPNVATLMRTSDGNTALRAI